MEKLDLIRGFLLSNKPVLNAQGTGEEITNPCTDCNGQGNKQTTKKISVTIPKGVDDGTRIRLAGKGEAGTKGGVKWRFVLIYQCQLS